MKQTVLYWPSRNFDITRAYIKKYLEVMDSPEVSGHGRNNAIKLDFVHLLGQTCHDCRKLSVLMPNLEQNFYKVYQ